MDLKIDGKYKEVNFWSFMKCNILVQLALTGMIWGGALILGLIFAIFL